MVFNYAKPRSHFPEFHKGLPRLDNAATQECNVLSSSTSHRYETSNTPWQQLWPSEKLDSFVIQVLSKACQMRTDAKLFGFNSYLTKITIIFRVKNDFYPTCEVYVQRKLGFKKINVNNFPQRLNDKAISQVGPDIYNHYVPL